MMRRAAAILPTVPLLVSLLAASATAQPKPHPAEDIERVSEYVQSLVDSREVAGAVAIVAHKGNVILHAAVGHAEMDPCRPMKPDTIFRIASMTKPVTSVAIMMLVEDGRVDLRDPVSKYIPAFANPTVIGGEKAKREITIRDLLTHTSGLGYNSTESIGELYMKAGIECGVRRSSMLLEDNIERLAGIPLAFEPGERFNYGMSTDVLGLVVEKASGMKLGEFIEQRICQPLGMCDTHFRVPAAKRERLAAAFIAEAAEGKEPREIGDEEEVWNLRKTPMSPDHAFAPDHRYLSGGGGLSSTAEDYLRFCQMILNGGRLGDVQLLKPETVQMMTSNQIGCLECAEIGGVKFKFGFGFAVLPRTDQFLGEIGWAGIWGTLFRISLDGDWIAILMTQRIIDETFAQRTVDFTRLVRDAVQGNGP